MRHLTFTLGGELYALDITEITEIIEFRSLTVVPMMPDYIRGVINLRGRVLPVVDLSARFGMGPTSVGRRTAIIVVEPRAREGEEETGGIGLMVDAVNKVVNLETTDIEPPPAFGAGIRSDFIGGMARNDEEFVIVLDLAHVVSLEEIATAT